MNAEEASRLNTPRHWNAQRVYPFWKICQVCSEPYPCLNRAQAARNKTCSKPCTDKAIGAKPRKRLPLSKRKGMKLVACAVCGKKVYKNRAWLKRVKSPVCSYQCNGVIRGQDWAKHAHKGRKAWTPESEAAQVKRMTGANNHAWKGGVTYFRKHGNYKPIKYVRCPEPFGAMARKDGYVMEHRLLVAQALGRPLLRRETVHHENHDPQDNRLTNLKLFANNRDHKLYEHHGSPKPLWPK